MTAADQFCSSLHRKLVVGFSESLGTVDLEMSVDISDIQ